MTGASGRFALATDFFGAHVHAVGVHSWSAATPCADWSVHDLVNHVVNEQLWAEPLIHGSTIADVGDRFEGDLLAADPVGAWDHAVGLSRSAFGAAGALDGIVHLSYGDERAENYANQMTLDALIHGWDLACGIGVDNAMPTELVIWAIGLVDPMLDDLVASGMFGTPLPVDDDADDQTRLLAMLGRNANWGR